MLDKERITDTIVVKIQLLPKMNNIIKQKNNSSICMNAVR